ncbi:hypothetical protein E1B28_013568 [Marasmius oreades]|uniref:Peptide hydrolase n=1 Tax=Marasmius oreades TaxID=181124 RepID=A0A9P7UN55_9AGAR|nr:uncharacterized protein E1B28_013568 [Marasmius oreades]KAG7087620.1 hypothetical protein E1B28_013568 [Marasmius oreades]
MTRNTRRGPIFSILLLSPILFYIPWLTYRHHSTLPDPLTQLVDPETNLPQLSEARVLSIAKYLSEDIGFRTPGTLEHARGEQWFFQQVLDAQKECQRVAESSGRKLECEVWLQRGNGSHRFDMMGARLYKTYVNLSNIIVRISNGTPEGKEHAVLVNSHLDSTLPTPGAADDAVSVGIMLECMRVLVETPGWSPEHAVILLWNNAEESLQDGSHLFSTQHPIAPTVRAVINLEAAGTKGKDLLFQATSEQMIQAYSHVPRPHGTIVANDVFGSGVILSDTDFRQFQQYLNVTGLDIAIVKNSYLYHMRKDLVENIEPGATQHMGENALALLRHLSSDTSQLPSLTGGYTKPTTVYVSAFGRFLLYSFTTAKIIYTLLFFASILLVKTAIPSVEKVAKDPSRSIRRGFFSALSGLLGSIVLANVVAVIMAQILGKKMSWFSSEYSTMVLYGPPAVLGALLPQLYIGEVEEAMVYSAILLMQTGVAVVVQFLGVGSACLLFLLGLSVFGGLLVNYVIGGSNQREMSLWTYAVGQVFPLAVGTMCAYPILDVFVPLAGRLGTDAPTDNIMATIVSVLGAISFPLIPPFIRRFDRSVLVRSVSLLSIVTAITIAVFAARDPYDSMHQKRIYILRTENITTGEHHLHISTSDGGPKFPELVQDIAKEFGVPPEIHENGDIEVFVPKAIVMNEYNSDWDPMYPFSAFLLPFKIPLPVEPSYVSPWSTPEMKFAITAVNDMIDREAGTRSLKLQVEHPGLIWTVIAFDAHVLKWNLDDNPPDEYTRHHVREASFYGTDTWSIDLVVKVEPGSTGSLLVNFIGLQEQGMWPGKKALMSQGNPGLALRLFERLDSWMDRRLDGKADVLLLGCVAGIERI